MKRFFRKELNLFKSESVEYLNFYLISALAALLYLSHCVAFLLFAFHPILILTQLLSVCVCVTAFLLNRAYKTRGASILMILLVCSTINVWAVMVDVGVVMRWYAVLTLGPLYFFNILSNRDKVILTVLLSTAFSSSTIVSYLNEPLVQMSYAPIYNAATSLIIFFSVAMELVLYKFINDKRDSELQRVGTILDNIECGIVIVDAESHLLLDINPVAERMFGGNKDTILGAVCHKLICLNAEGACPITDMGQDIDRSERVLVKENGETVPIIKSVAKIQYNGRPALLESFTDISSLKEAEEKLRLFKITEQSNRAKSDFLSRMSHEMRTPMNAIIGMAKIAEGTEDISKLKHCLYTIDISSSHLLGIINDILDMSKIEAGKLELDYAAFLIEKMLAKVEGIMVGQAKSKHIDFSIIRDVGADVRYIGDELRLTQVIINLLSNAVKFTPDGGKVTLLVSEDSRGDGFSTLKFVVFDTGIGMTEEQRGKLFRAFEQADGSITRKFGGTGLGLAISMSIVEKMGGKIRVESAPGKGSVFTVEIRLEIAGVQTDIETTSANANETPDFSGVTILLAEDVEINREIFIALLESTNILIDIAENGVEAVEKFKDNPERYSAIIMDIHMPMMNGHEATEKIRCLDMDKAKSIPIIAMTADVFKADIDKCLACGMNSHLKKPIEVDKVIEVLSHFIGK